MKRILTYLLFIELALMSVLPGTAAGMTVARLTLDSEPGDLIGQGGMFDIFYELPGDTVSPQIRGSLPDGSPAKLLFVLDSPEPGNQFALAFFGTDQLGIPIQPGTYTDAQRADFASPGHPGLDISFQNRGSNTLTGSFTIFDVSFVTDSSGQFRIDTFDAEFEQHSEGVEPALFGRFQYDASGLVIPLPPAVWLFGSGLLGLIGMARKKAA